MSTRAFSYKEADESISTGQHGCVWPLTSHLTSLSLSFLIHKVDKIVSLPEEVDGGLHKITYVKHSERKMTL